MRIANPMYDVVFKHLLEDMAAASSPEVAESMRFEDEVVAAWEAKEREVAELAGTVAERDEAIAQRDAAIAELGGTVAVRDATIARLMAEVAALRQEQE